MEKSKLTEKQINELIGNEELLKVQQEQEQIKELEKEINDLEMELDWADSQSPEDYKYITHLEHRLDKLYDEYNKIDNLGEIL